MQVGIDPPQFTSSFTFLPLLFFLQKIILLKSDYIVANSSGIFSAEMYMGFSYL